MWVFDTSSEDISDPPATNLSAPYILPVGANLDVYMSPEQKIIGDTNWLRYNFGTSRHIFFFHPGDIFIPPNTTDTIVPTTFTNMPTVTLTPFYSNWTTSDVMTPTDPPSIFTALLSVIGKLGGVFVTLNGIFVIVFGRTVWAVVAGTSNLLSGYLHILDARDLRTETLSSQAVDQSLPSASSATSRGTGHQYTDTTHDSNLTAKAAAWQDSSKRSRWTLGLSSIRIIIGLIQGGWQGGLHGGRAKLMTRLHLSRCVRLVRTLLIDTFTPVWTSKHTR